jgi:hypothetical protein
MQRKTIQCYAPYGLPNRHPEYKRFEDWLRSVDPGFRCEVRISRVPRGDRRKADGWMDCWVTYERVPGNP